MTEPPRVHWRKDYRHLRRVMLWGSIMLVALLVGVLTALAGYRG